MLSSFCSASKNFFTDAFFQKATMIVCEEIISVVIGQGVHPIFLLKMRKLPGGINIYASANALSCLKQHCR
jgi:hypothetical protein